jgi:hypothetical protein
MRDTLRLSVCPGIEKYVNRMQQIKEKINGVIEMAMIDFIMVSSVFKRYNQFIDPAVPDEEVARRVSHSVTELQYMDFFSQKFNHTILLNQHLIDADGNSVQSYDHAGFIFRLNFMQAIVASDEFLVYVNSLKKNLSTLHDHIVSVTKLDFHVSTYFRHMNEIEERLKEIKAILNEIQNERLREVPAATVRIDEEMRKISDLYTMTSERFVLLWLLKNITAEADELLIGYKQEGYEALHEEIDIF